MEFFDSAPEVQAKKCVLLASLLCAPPRCYFHPCLPRYAFKCHRVADKAKNLDIVYPVNAIAFHPTFGTFATGGCDSNVIMWDGINRRRLQQPWKYNNTIAALSFNCTGQALAIAASYTFEEGEKEHAPDAVIVKSVTEADVKPRPKA
jgi:cell cycle arrest protein BUB3